jgi:hypothetical protein
MAMGVGGWGGGVRCGGVEPVQKHHKYGMCIWSACAGIQHRPQGWGGQAQRWPGTRGSVHMWHLSYSGA